jgi:hypothetical protein
VNTSKKVIQKRMGELNLTRRGLMEVRLGAWKGSKTLSRNVALSRDFALAEAKADHPLNCIDACSSADYLTRYVMLPFALEGQQLDNSYGYDRALQQ